MQKKTTAFTKETYEKILNINDEKQIQFAEDLALALHEIDPSLIQLSGHHPFGNIIFSAKPDLDFLINKASDTNIAFETRINAFDALSHLFLKQTPPASTSFALKRILANESDKRIRQAVSKCICLAKDNDFLAEQACHLSDKDPQVVASACMLIGYGKYRKALPLLLELVSPKRFFESENVIWAIGEIGSSKAVPILAGALQSGFQTIHCLTALGKIGDPTALIHVMPFLSRASKKERETAYQALASILQRKRKDDKLNEALSGTLVHLVQAQLDSANINDTVRTKFYMLLALARLGQQLPPHQIKNYLQTSLDDNNVGKLTTFFLKRTNFKNI